MPNSKQNISANVQALLTLAGNLTEAERYQFSEVFSSRFVIEPRTEKERLKNQKTIKEAQRNAHFAALQEKWQRSKIRDYSKKSA